MPSPHHLQQNRLLAALSDCDAARIASHLQLVALRSGEVLYESGTPLRQVYFPLTCVVSLSYVMEDGACAEIAVVGNDGMLGIAVFMGGQSTPSRAVVQNSGQAFRLDAAYLKSEFDRAGSLLSILLRYTQSLLTQMAQTAVCNRHHDVEQQLCRWLLMRIDRLPSYRLAGTHEAIASMLGVRREGVTEAAGRLQRSGLIRYSRGAIEVLDRPGLEARACECYRAFKRESDRLLAARSSAPAEHQSV